MGKSIKSLMLVITNNILVSTIESLSKRMAKHRYKYKLYLTNEGQPRVSCYDIFEEYDIDNCKIELVEYFNCETKEELFKREGEYIRNNDCVNQIIAGRTIQEYNAENKEHKRETDKLYYELNKPSIQAKAKQYRNNNKEKIKQHDKEYYEKNKQKWVEFYQQNKERLREERRDYLKQYREKEENKIRLKTRKSEIHLCECGYHYTFGHRLRHLRSNKHQEALNNLNNSNNVQQQSEIIPTDGETEEREEI